MDFSIYTYKIARVGMDPVRNPFAPGAGSRPPELAGRETVIEDAEIAVQRVLRGRPTQSQMLLGLRGVGKTVLLNRIEEIAESHGHVTSFIEAPENKSFAELLYPKAHQAIRQLSMYESAKAKAHQSMRALRAFASVFKIAIGDVSIAVDPEPGLADSGNLEFDLTDLFISIGETAKAAGRAWTLLVDEVQYLDERELAGIIVSVHRISQKGLPVLFFGAGLPQVAALSGDAKSYAERLFKYPAIGPLDIADAQEAIRQPIEDEGESIDDDALAFIVEKTDGYPYFLQEWGYQSWDVADASPIERADAERASQAALARLDEGFFKVRFDRLTPKEREYVIAMAKLGKGPYRSSDVADALGENVQTLGPRRAQIIKKGMIYSPAHGDIAFTVPMFEDYLARNLM
jgi:hypothetical protein